MMFYDVIDKIRFITLILSGIFAILVWTCMPLILIIPSIVYAEVVFMTLGLIFAFVTLVLIICDGT